MLTRENFRGCVIGQSVADALGMPVERQSPSQCQEYVQIKISGCVRFSSGITLCLVETNRAYRSSLSPGFFRLEIQRPLKPSPD